MGMGNGEWGISVNNQVKRSIDLLSESQFSRFPLGRVFKPGDPPQPPLKRGEQEYQSPPS